MNLGSQYSASMKDSPCQHNGHIQETLTAYFLNIDYVKSYFYATGKYPK